MLLNPVVAHPTGQFADDAFLDLIVGLRLRRIAFFQLDDVVAERCLDQRGNFAFLGQLLDRRGKLRDQSFCLAIGDFSVIASLGTVVGILSDEFNKICPGKCLGACGLGQGLCLRITALDVP